MKLGDMLPTFAADDTANDLLAYTESKREINLTDTSTGIERPDRTNVIIGQFGPTVVLAACLSSLADHITTIFGRDAKKQMNRVCAQGTVASVQNREAIGNRAVEYFPANSVRSQCTMAWRTASNLAVAILTGLAFPLPALCGYGRSYDVLPESISQGYHRAPKFHVSTLSVFTDFIIARVAP